MFIDLCMYAYVNNVLIWFFNLFFKGHSLTWILFSRWYFYCFWNWKACCWWLLTGFWRLLFFSLVIFRITWHFIWHLIVLFIWNFITVYIFHILESRSVNQLTRNISTKRSVQRSSEALNIKNAMSRRRVSTPFDGKRGWIFFLPLNNVLAI